MIYSIADFKFEFNPKYQADKHIPDGFLSDGTPDFVITVEDKDIMFEKSISKTEFSNSQYEYIAFCRKISNLLPSYNGMLMHCALFDVEGEGVALAALSGTGKTTHMLLWQKLLGDKMKIVNGDKPFIRFDENSGKIYGYGTLWQGKERLGCNMKTELKHICFIERSKTNSCEKIDKSLATNLIFNQVYMPKTPNETIATLKLIDRIMKNVNLWIIKCNMEPNSAVVAYNEIFKKGKI